MADAGWSEARTIREMVIPSLLAAGWADAARRSEYQITPGGRQVIDGHVRYTERLRADLVLLHGERPIAVVEAKKSMRDHRTGVPAGAAVRRAARRLAGLRHQRPPYR